MIIHRVLVNNGQKLYITVCNNIIVINIGYSYRVSYIVTVISIGVYYNVAYA